MPPAERTEVVTLRLTDAERRMLTRIAELDGVSASDVLRQLLRKGFARNFECVLCERLAEVTHPQEGRNPWRLIFGHYVCDKCFRQWKTQKAVQEAVTAAIVKKA